MDEPDWGELEDWFHRCEEADDEECERLLAQLREEQPALYEELVELRRAERPETERGMELVAGVVEKGLDLRPGDRLGPYRLEEEIGRGGMGAVFRAERADGQFEQTVAIKLVKDAVPRPDLRDRFRRERQTLARLDDPRIVRLFDGGVTEEGLEYFVMEYVVGGVPIDQFCDERRLRIPERLRLFEQTARAVHSAHRRFVVHRDLKPSNILIDRDGAPKLLDFGIAKDVERDRAGASLTVSGQRLMTPEYASPEQISGGPITPATDVYSLGVILHGLLCGRSPYRAQSEMLHSLEQAICEQEPLWPSAAITGRDATEIAAKRSTDPRRLRRRLRGPADTIVMKALAKDPEERYASAEQLADDVLRLIQGVPILATPPSWAARAKRVWVRSRRRIVLVALVALAAGVHWWRTQDLSEAADGQAAVVAGQEEEITEIQGIVSHLLRLADPWSETRPNSKLVDRVLGMLDSDPIRDPNAELELRIALNQQLRALNRLAEAGQQLDHAEGLAPTIEVSDKLRRRLAIERVEHEFASGRMESALQHAESLVDGMDRSTAVEPEDRAYALRLLARSQRWACAYGEAMGHVERACAVLQETAAIDDELRLVVLSDRALLSMAQGEFALAEIRLRECIDAALPRMGSRHGYVLNARCNLAEVLMELRRHDEAFTILDEAEAGWQLALGDDHPQLAHAASVRAHLLEATGREREAEPSLRRAVELCRRHRGPRHLDTLMSENNLANWLIRGGQVEEGEALLRSALARATDALGPRHRAVALLTNNLGDLMTRLDRPQEAQRLAERALELRLAALGPDHPDTLKSRTTLAIAHGMQNRGADAAEQRAAIVAVLERQSPPNVPELAEQLIILGRHHHWLKEHEQAAQHLGRAAELLDTLTPPLVGAYTSVCVLWARSVASMGEFDTAMEILARLEDTLETATEDVEAYRRELERCHQTIERWRERDDVSH